MAFDANLKVLIQTPPFSRDKPCGGCKPRLRLTA